MNELDSSCVYIKLAQTSSKVILNSLTGSCVAHEDGNNSHNEEINEEELCIREIGISLKI